MDIIQEIEFWTGIMRDHAEFQFTSLAPTENEAIQRTVFFMDLFERLNLEAAANREKGSAKEIIADSKRAVKQFIEFKKHLLKGLMTCNIELRMAPSFLNHMINEALEFKRVLDISDGTIPHNRVLENIRLHKVWLPDASGHANNISSELDAIESELKKEAQKYAKKFDCLFKKAFEMYTMYERTGLENGALYRFNDDVIKTLTDFIYFLEKVEDLRDECKAFGTGTFSPLVPNHMMREESYYIYKVKQLQG